MEDTVAIIPMRAGSKGLPQKNIKPLAGKPLYRYAVDEALEAGIGRVLISTDIPELPEKVASSRVETLPRPAALAGDAVPMADVMMHVLEAEVDPEQIVVLLQPTSPLRDATHIASALEVFRTSDSPLLMSVSEKERSILKYGFVEGNRYIPLGQAEWVFSNRQALPPVFGPNGAIYIFEAGWFLKNGGFASPDVAVFEMDQTTSLDIDCQADFMLCEAAINSRNNQKADV